MMLRESGKINRLLGCRKGEQGGRCRRVTESCAWMEWITTWGVGGFRLRGRHSQKIIETWKAWDESEMVIRVPWGSKGGGGW